MLCTAAANGSPMHRLQTLYCCICPFEEGVLGKRPSSCSRFSGFSALSQQLYHANSQACCLSITSPLCRPSHCRLDYFCSGSDGRPCGRVQRAGV